jgi:hypothetical protein
VYKFTVFYPFGTTAIQGYRRAARYFGLHTRIDPTTEGTDQWRLLVHKDAKLLRRTAKTLLDHAMSESDNFDAQEFEILLNSGIHWFAQDWKWWDIQNDDGALEHLGWSRAITELPNGSFRVVLRRLPRRKA